MGARGLRSTKVVGTIGPACDSPEQIRALIGAGLNVARLNFSHGNHEQHAEVVKRIREAERDLGSHIAIMGDTRGPEVRTGLLRDGAVRLDDGEPFTLRTAEGPGDQRSVWVSHSSLPDEVQPHRSIYLDDGSIQLSVSAIRPGEVDCIVMRGGILGERKGVSVPGSDLSLPALGDSDLADLTFAAQQRFDYVAASFIRSAEHIEHIRSVLREAGEEIPVIAKIEHRSAVDNLAEIVAAADGTMVARGDLGVEMPVEQVPLIQKRIIRVTVGAGKPVITATQMLDSMERRSRPTRAEASDVANAILDGTSAVMLSGETAIGKYPLEAVRTMGDIAREAELGLAEYGALQHNPEPLRDRVTDAVAHAACEIAERAHAAAILTLTETGHTSRAISKHRPGCPIFALSSSEGVVRRLALNWGVTGLHYPGGASTDDEEKLQYGIQRVRAIAEISSAPIVITAGISRSSGSTNLVRVVQE
ncbi:MAG: pyruvate kinase [Myxococcota bacterium]|nr:pyruvate kinase [Myxococcota bacterium]